MLTHEKKSIGYYVSGHPLEPYRTDILSFTSHKASGLADVKQGETVLVGGVIVAITRKLDRNGNAFAIVKLEDFTGKIECIFWSDAFRTYQHLVVDEKPVFLRGKIRKGGPDEAPTVVVDEAFEIAGMRKKVTRGVLLRLYDGEESNKAIRDVQAICAKYKGNCNTFITIETAQGASRKYRLGETFKVEPSDELVRECDKIFGTNRLLFCR